MTNEIDRSRASLEQMRHAWQNPGPGWAGARITALWILYSKQDDRTTRNEVAKLMDICTRSVDRWVIDFNRNGLDKAGTKSWASPGRRPIVERSEFLTKVLPQIEKLAAAANGPVTIKTLFACAKASNLFAGSYSTFCRCLGERAQQYRRPVQVDPPPWPHHLQAGQGADAYRARLAEHAQRRPAKEDPSGQAKASPWAAVPGESLEDEIAACLQRHRRQAAE